MCVRQCVLTSVTILNLLLSSVCRLLSAMSCSFEKSSMSLFANFNSLTCTHTHTQRMNEGERPYTHSEVCITHTMNTHRMHLFLASLCVFVCLSYRCFEAVSFSQQWAVLWHPADHHRLRVGGTNPVMMTMTMAVTMMLVRVSHLLTDACTS